MDGKSEKEKKDKKKDDDDIEWDIEDLKQAYIDAAKEQYDRYQ